MWSNHFPKQFQNEFQNINPNIKSFKRGLFQKKMGSSHFSAFSASSARSVRSSGPAGFTGPAGVMSYVYFDTDFLCTHIFGHVYTFWFPLFVWVWWYWLVFLTQLLMYEQVVFIFNLFTTSLNEFERGNSLNLISRSFAHNALCGFSLWLRFLYFTIFAPGLQVWFFKLFFAPGVLYGFSLGPWLFFFSHFYPQCISDFTVSVIDWTETPSRSFGPFLMKTLA